jgi:hypothetical protein
MVTPFYWGNHLPLARRKPTGINIDDLAAMTPAHNAMMSWGHRRPQPLESRTADMPDALGVTRKMQVEKWAWLIGHPTTPNAAPRSSQSRNPKSHSRLSLTHPAFIPSSS